MTFISGADEVGCGMTFAVGIRFACSPKNQPRGESGPEEDGRTKRSRYTEEPIIGILQEQEAGTPVAELCRKHGMSDATFYTWKSKYAGLEVSEAKRRRALGAENAKLKRLLADAMLDNAALKDLVGKNGDARCWP